MIDVIFFVIVYSAAFMLTLVTGYQAGWEARGREEADARSRQSG